MATNKKIHLQFVNQETGKPLLTRTFNPAQLKFWNSKKPFVVLNGGFGSGKTEPLILKMILSAMEHPDNYILAGRKTYQEIYDVLLKDFLDLCPQYFIKTFKKSPHPSIELHCPNSDKTSTIIFRNLDKLAEAEIKGLNLGEIFIDQAEDIPEDVFQALTFRLRRQGCPHKVWMTVNPALNWIYQRAKVEHDDRWDVIEASSIENYHNLPESTVKMYESYKETDPAYYRQYVLGVWDESLMSENTVFAREHIDKITRTVKDPIRTYEGLLIYKKYIPEHIYQMGIDCAEGLEGRDRASIHIVDLSTLEVVAHWAGRLPPDVVAEKAVVFADLYSKSRFGLDACKIVPEMNAMGLALLNKLRDLGYERLYQRETLDKKTGAVSLQLGWRTTAQTKPLLVSNFRHLLRNFEPKLYDKETAKELRAFVYSDQARLKGMGAQTGFHDDRVISLLLAYWEKKKRGVGTVIKTSRETEQLVPKSEIEPSLQIIRGKLQWNIPILKVDNLHKKWTMT